MNINELQSLPAVPWVWGRMRGEAEAALGHVEGIYWHASMVRPMAFSHCGPVAQASSIILKST